MKERDLQKAIIHYLQLLENQGKLYFIRNNTFQGQLKRRDGSFGYMRQGKKGCADLIVFFTDPFHMDNCKQRTIFIELKSDTGDLSKEQHEFAVKIQKLGYEYRVIRSVEELIMVLK
jgi:hypothetical protein